MTPENFFVVYLVLNPYNGEIVLCSSLLPFSSPYLNHSPPTTSVLLCSRTDPSSLAGYIILPYPNEKLRVLFTTTTTTTTDTIPLILLVLGDVDWQCTPPPPVRVRHENAVVIGWHQKRRNLTPSALCGVEWFWEWDIPTHGKSRCKDYE